MTMLITFALSLTACAPKNLSPTLPYEPTAGDEESTSDINTEAVHRHFKHGTHIITYAERLGSSRYRLIKL